MKILYYFGFIAAMLVSAKVSGQGTWENAGPDNIGGKTRALAWVGNRLLAGSTGGGLWYSDDKGASWKRMDSYAIQGGSPVVTSILVDNGKIYVATGETELLTTAKMTATSNDFSTPDAYWGASGLPGSGLWVGTPNGNGDFTWSNENYTNNAATGAKSFTGPFASIQKVFKTSDGGAFGGKVYIGARRKLFSATPDNISSMNPYDTASIVLDSAKVKFAGGLRKADFNRGVVYDIEEIITEGGTKLLFAMMNVVKAGNSRSGDYLIYSKDGINFRAIDELRVGGIAFKIGNRRGAIATSSDKKVLYVTGVDNTNKLTGVWRLENLTTFFEDSTNDYRCVRFAPAEVTGFTPLGGKGRDALTLEVFPDDADHVIVGGNAWFTYTKESGWLQTAQSSTAGNNLYLPNAIHTVLFSPNYSTDSTFYIGTDKQITRTTNGGKTFTLRSKGYEVGAFVSAAAINVAVLDSTDETKTLLTNNAILGGSTLFGTQYNGFYDSNLPTNQGFGRITTTSYSNIEVSNIYPGALIVQASDLGLQRSIDRGKTFEEFYGVPINFPTYLAAQNISFTASDSSGLIINKTKLKSESGGLVNSPANAPYQVQFVLDEVIPQSVRDSILDGTLNAKHPKGIKNVLQSHPMYAFFGSKDFIWLVERPLGSPDKKGPNWTRISNDLTSDGEFFTAMAVSGDDNHTLYAATSKGKLVRITNPLQILEPWDSVGISGTKIIYKSKFDANTNVKTITAPLANRWISSISVNPLNRKGIVITYAGYGDDVKTKDLVYYTDDATAATVNFTNLATTLPGTEKEPIYTSAFVADPANVGSELLYIGTESGLYYTNNLVSPTWTRETMNGELVNVPVTDIFVRQYSAEILNEVTKQFRLKADNSVFVATHGKGMYFTKKYQYPQRSANETPIVETGFEAIAYPNPANNEVNVLVDMPEAANVTSQLLSIDGRVIATNQNTYTAGNQVITFATDKLPTGVYFVKVSAEAMSTNFNQTIKVVVAH